MLRHRTSFTLLLASAFGITTSVFAQESKDAPTVEVTRPDYALSSESCQFSLERFRNSTAYVFEGGTVSDSAELRNGNFERDDNPGHVASEFKWLMRRSGQAQSVSYAIALYFWEWAGGSSSQSDIVQVFGCKDGHPLVLQQISNDAHSENAGVKFDPVSGILTVKSVRYGSGAHCCPEKLDIVTFRWSGNGFQRLGWKTVPMPKSR